MQKEGKGGSFRRYVYCTLAAEGLAEKRSGDSLDDTLLDGYCRYTIQ